MNKIFLIMVAALSLSACSSRYSSNGENLYLKSQNGGKLEVPKPLSNENISNFYDLPPQKQDAQVSIAPPA